MMGISKYISELLYDYECVIIPGFGGFITSDKSVLINEVTHSFTPPFRKIQFNTQLQENDGLLVNYIAQQDKVEYSVAKQLVDKFVYECQYELESGQTKVIKYIGSIHFDENKNIVFHQDLKVNYDSGSFGLSSLVSPAIRRVSDEEKVKKAVVSVIKSSKTRKKPIDRKGEIKEESKRRNLVGRNSLLLLLVIILLSGGGYLYFQRDSAPYYFDKYASYIPFFYSSVNDYISDNINSEPVAKLSRSTASLFPIVIDDDPNAHEISSVTKEEIIESVGNDEIRNVEINNNDVQLIEASADIQNEDVVIDEESYATPTESTDNKNITEDITENVNISKAETTSLPTDGRYFIIGGSFSKEANAVRFVDELRNEGFDALLAGTSKKGMYRVAMMRLVDRHVAKEKLVAIRNEHNPNAWLLVK